VGQKIRILKVGSLLSTLKSATFMWQLLVLLIESLSVTLKMFARPI